MSILASFKTEASNIPNIFFFYNLSVFMEFGCISTRSFKGLSVCQFSLFLALICCRRFKKLHSVVLSCELVLNMVQVVMNVVQIIFSSPVDGVI